MATLTTTQRRDVLKTIGSLLSAKREPIALLKPDLAAAVDATDDWINDNAAAFNDALPAPAKANLTSNQKLRLFLLVASKRLEVS